MSKKGEVKTVQANTKLYVEQLEKDMHSIFKREFARRTARYQTVFLEKLFRDIKENCTETEYNKFVKIFNSLVFEYAG